MDRRYTRNKKYGPCILESYRQRRCIICQRFLSTRQRKYCTRCQLIEHKRMIGAWNEKNIEKCRISARDYQRRKRMKDNGKVR